MPDRTCERCAKKLPEGCRSTKRFCSRHCVSAAQYAREGDKMRRNAQAWRVANADRLRSESRLRHVHRTCTECGESLPPGSTARRQLCSKKCYNARSLRRDAAARRETDRRRRARLRAATVPGVSARDWEWLKRRHRGRCAYCDRMAPLTMDHVVPLVRGGQHAIGNILPACHSCNASKRDRLLVEWAQRPQRRRLASAA